MERSVRGGPAPRKAESSVQFWQICICIVPLTGGWLHKNVTIAFNNIVVDVFTGVEPLVRHDNHLSQFVASLDLKIIIGNIIYFLQ